MSQSTVVSYPQVLGQLSTESSEEAKDSQVNAILSPDEARAGYGYNSGKVFYYLTINA
jgi:hypothetical protein